MLIIIPNRCQTCHKEIPQDKCFGEGNVYVKLEVFGVPPFKIEGHINFCSFEHFLQWYSQNVKQLNVTETKEEIDKKAIAEVKKLEKNFKEEK